MSGEPFPPASRTTKRHTHLCPTCMRYVGCRLACSVGDHNEGHPVECDDCIERARLGITLQRSSMPRVADLRTEEE